MIAATFALALALQDAPADAAASQALDAARLTRVSLDFVTDPWQRVRLVVPVLGEPLQLELEPADVRSQQFAVRIQTTSGAITNWSAPASGAVRGRVLRHGLLPIGTVAGSLEGGMLRAKLTADGAVYGVQPLLDALPGAAPGEHVVYASDDLLPSAALCGEPAGAAPAAPPSQPAVAPAVGALRQAEMAFDVDFEGLQKYGSIGAAVAEIEALVATMAVSYEAELGITYKVGTIVIREAEPDPYTAPDHQGLLTEFKTEWNTQQTAVKRDLAYLFTGRQLGNVAGFATVKTVCNLSNAYGLSRALVNANFAKRASNLAHEVGHMWGALHCDGSSDCGIMCGTLGGCNMSLTVFGATSVNEMKPLTSAASCLTTIPAPLSAPFADGFEGSSIAADRWTTNSGAAAGTTAIAEPGGTRAANLDGTDSLESNRFLLSAASGLVAGFWVEHRGPAAGETLLFEYLNSASAWTALLTAESDGTVQSVFRRKRALLPGDAYHDQLRLRFKAGGNAATDDWFIDDVTVAAGAASAAVAGSDAIVQFQPVGSASAVPRSLPVTIDGTPGLALPWSAAEAVDVPWLAVTSGAGISDGVSPEPTATIQLTTAALAEGLHRAFVRVTDTAGGSSFFDVPVTAVVVPEVGFVIGDTLEGAIADPADQDRASFLALAGTTVSFKAKLTVGSSLQPVIEVASADGSFTKTITFGTLKKDTIKSLKLPASGLYHARISGAGGTSGAYAIATSAKLPKLGVLAGKKLAPKVAGGVLELPFLALPGSRLEAAVVPSAGTIPLVLELLPPSGAALATGTFEGAYGAAGRALFGIPLGEAGAYRLRISGFAAKEAVVVTLTPSLPAGGATVAVP